MLVQRHPHAERGLDQLRQALEYNPHSGEFTWRVARANRKPGDAAGNVGPNGYRTVTVNYRSHYAHHLAIAFSSGVFPQHGSHVDHINGDKSDNRIENLRVVTPSCNGLNRHKPNRNNTSGIRGVSFDSRRHSWLAQICIDGRYSYLGRFKTREQAAAAWERAVLANAPEVHRISWRRP